MSLKVPNPFKNYGRHEFIPETRQLTPGPCNTSKGVMLALLNQPLMIWNEYFAKICKDIQEMTRYLYQTKNEYVIAGQFSGNGGNEALVVNLADPGDTVIVATSGFWGQNVADMGRRYKLNVIELRTEPSEVYTFEELEQQIIKHKPKVLFITHGESSGGTLQPLNGLGEICHKYDCLLAVDAVISLGVVPFLMDEWEIDAANAGVQKGVGAPAGMCLLTMNDRAYNRMLSNKHPVPYIFDLKAIGEFFGCYDKPKRYVCTYGTHSLTSIRQALIEICEEGLESIWERHQTVSDLFMDGVKKLGCHDFITKPENRFAGSNCIIMPKDVDLNLLMDYTLYNHQIEWSFGIGPTLNKAVRISFLCQNAKPEIAEDFLKILKKGFDYCRKYPEKAKDCRFAKCLGSWKLGEMKKLTS